MIADGDATRGRSDLFDDAGRLVPEHDRHREAQRSLDHFEVGVAQAGGANPHQHIVGFQRMRGDGLDRQRRARLTQHRGAVLKRHLGDRLAGQRSHGQIDVGRVHLPLIAEIGDHRFA